MTSLSELERLLHDLEDLKAWRVAHGAEHDRVSAELADLRRRADGASK